MAFKEKKKVKDRYELISFIDMIFILFVFFLVTSFVIRTPYEERGLSIPTPENTLGRAQIVIQFVDEEHVFWLDESASSLVKEMEDNYGYLSSQNLRKRIISELIAGNVIPIDVLEEKLNSLRARANENPRQKYFVLIRCPNHIPYHRVVNVIAAVSDTEYRNIQYGCIGGTLDQIRECRRVYTVVERDETGNRRRNIRIDF